MYFITLLWGELKEDMVHVFGDLCWFSEVKDCYSHLEVEHFRPKKETKDLEGNIREGYWWLAFDWKNYRIVGNVGNRMKGGYFPLRDGSPVATSASRNTLDEDYLFLDPVEALDVVLLSFEAEGLACPTFG